MWFSLIATVIMQPLQYPVWVSWLSVTAGTLLVRNGIAVLMELSAVLAHMHHTSHEATSEDTM